jgi:hypothetical protein
MRPREAWRLTACEGKTRFDTFTAAARVLKRNRDNKIRRMVYRCCDCAGFHIGTPPPKGAK